MVRRRGMRLSVSVRHADALKTLCSIRDCPALLPIDTTTGRADEAPAWRRWWLSAASVLVRSPFAHGRQQVRSAKRSSQALACPTKSRLRPPHESGDTEHDHAKPAPSSGTEIPGIGAPDGGAPCLLPTGQPLEPIPTLGTPPHKWVIPREFGIQTRIGEHQADQDQAEEAEPLHHQQQRADHTEGDRPAYRTIVNDVRPNRAMENSSCADHLPRR